MSHEIRTPLNGILGMLQLLQASRLDAEQGELVQVGISSSRRLHQLLNDILDLSKVESGKFALRIDTVSIADMRRSILEVFALTANEKHIQLLFEIDPSLPPTLRGDEVRLRQVLFNLVGNALKYTEKGSVRIRMGLCEPGDDQSPRVEFVVEDTGAGIPSQHLEDIFHPFTQVDNSMTRASQGAGLGLAIVKRLVDLMGGTVTLTSEVGRGTIVAVRLPLDREEALPVSPGVGPPARHPRHLSLTSSRHGLSGAQHPSPIPKSRRRESSADRRQR